MKKLVIKLRQSFGIGKYFFIAFCICCSFLIQSTTINAVCNHVNTFKSRSLTQGNCFSETYKVRTYCTSCYEEWIDYEYVTFSSPRHNFSGIRNIGCNEQTHTHTYQYYCSGCGATGATFTGSCNCK